MIREQMLAAENVKALEWRDHALYLLDQRLLPQEEHWQRYETAAEVAQAIREMRVRGAPAIGVAAAFGVVVPGRTRTVTWRVPGRWAAQWWRSLSAKLPATQSARKADGAASVTRSSSPLMKIPPMMPRTKTSPDEIARST